MYLLLLYLSGVLFNKYFICLNILIKYIIVNCIAIIFLMLLFFPTVKYLYTTNNMIIENGFQNNKL